MKQSSLDIVMNTVLFDIFELQIDDEDKKEMLRYFKYQLTHYNELYGNVVQDEIPHLDCSREKIR